MHRWIPALLLLFALPCHAAITEGDVRAVAAASDAFACELYARLAAEKPDANLAFSPFSLSTALNMASLGASGKTAEEFAKLLHQPQMEPFHAIAGGLPRGFAKSKDFTFLCENRLWLHQALPVLPAFTNALQKDYAAPPSRVDFTNPNAATKTINDAVAAATHNRITALIPDNALDANTRFVLTNTLYFRAAWDASFPKTATADADFHLSPDRTIKVPMMHQTASYGIAGTDEYQAVEIPYKGQSLAMLFLIAREGKTLADVETKLNPGHLQDLGNHIAPAKIDLSVPRFKTTASFDAADALQKLGLKFAFTGDADFSAITADNRLQLSAVFHKTWISVDEEGTEAAAASAVAAIEKGFGGPPPDKITLDRPFLWMILEPNSRLILFMGRITDPTK